MSGVTNWQSTMTAFLRLLFFFFALPSPLSSPRSRLYYVCLYACVCLNFLCNLLSCLTLSRLFTLLNGINLFNQQDLYRRLLYASWLINFLTSVSIMKTAKRRKIKQKQKQQQKQKKIISSKRKVAQCSP